MYLEDGSHRMKATEWKSPNGSHRMKATERKQPDRNLRNGNRGAEATGAEATG